ncbi:MAG: acyl-CoA thioesterase [Chloroflexia bacterium]
MMVGAITGEESEPGFTVEVVVRFRDLDARGHVNNAVYLTYFEIARLAMWTKLTGSLNLQDREMIVAEITCTYKSPALFNELLAVTVVPVAIRRTSFILRYRIVERTSGRLIATGRGARRLRLLHQPADARLARATRGTRSTGGSSAWSRRGVKHGARNKPGHGTPHSPFRALPRQRPRRDPQNSRRRGATAPTPRRPHRRFPSIRAAST